MALGSFGNAFLALLSQEGSAARSVARGVVPQQTLSEPGLGTTPRTISTTSRSCCPPDSGGPKTHALDFRIPGALPVESPHAFSAVLPRLPCTCVVLHRFRRRSCRGGSPARYRHLHR